MRFLSLIAMICSAWLFFLGVEESSKILLVAGVICYTLNTFFFIRAFEEEVPK